MYIKYFFLPRKLLNAFTQRKYTGLRNFFTILLKDNYSLSESSEKEIMSS